MSSQYDSIRTAADLVKEVMMHGLSMEQKDICRAQDIFGNSPISELVRLANDIGRNNENGEPDPKGTRSSGRKATQGTFYMIAAEIWNWEDVTRFWNAYTNPQTEELRGLRAANKQLIKDKESLTASRDQLLERVKKGAENISRLTMRVEEERRKAEKAEDEVVRLKAMLYDILTTEKGVA